MVSLPDPAALDETFSQDFAKLVEQIRAGTLPSTVVDQATAERWLLRFVGALLWLQERHRIDTGGRCSICWNPPRRWWWPWPTHTTCTVHAALWFYLRQPGWSVLSVITDGYLSLPDTP